MKTKKLRDLFDVRYGHSLELNRLKIVSAKEGIAFISRKMGDNGIAAYVERIPDIEPNPSGELTCAMSGNGVLTTFVQDNPYYTAFHIACLRPKFALTKQELLYYCLCIRENKYRYSWGRQANRSLRDIELPNESEIPKWVNQTDVNLFSGRDAALNKTSSLPLDTKNWKQYKLGDLFELRKGKRLTKANMTFGQTPFIGSIDKNNGVSTFIGQEPLHAGNTITINYNGSVGEAFYQPIPFSASDDVNVLYPKFEMSPAIAMFIITIIRQEKYRFNYGRKWHLERMKQSEIRLPTSNDSIPDWDYMERFIMSVPFSSQL